MILSDGTETDKVAVLCFFVIKSFSFKVLFSGPPDLEFSVFNFKSSVSSVTVGLFYRPPNAPVSIFDTLLNSLCLHVDVSLLTNFILLGDFNINMLNCNPCNHLYSKLSQFASSLCLTQVVSEPILTAHLVRVPSLI